MTPKINKTLLSAAVISGLLITAAPAHAADLTEESASAVIPEVAVSATAPAATTTPAEATTVEELASTPASQLVTDTTTVSVAEPIEEPAPAPTGEFTAPSEIITSAETPDVTGAVAFPAEVSAVPEDEPAAKPTVESVGAVQESTVEPAPSAVKISHAEETNLESAVVDSLDEELSEEELAELEELVPLFPEGSQDWDDAQWDEFLLSDDGQDLLSLVLVTILDSVPDSELEAFIDELRASFPGDEQWFDDFIASYLGLEQPPVDAEPATPTPTVQAKPEAAAIVPVAQAVTKPVVQTEKVASPQAEPHVLADTGFSGLQAGGLGLGMALIGAILLRLRRQGTSK